jgi:hypothetical protein
MSWERKWKSDRFKLYHNIGIRCFFFGMDMAFARTSGHESTPCSAQINANASAERASHYTNSATSTLVGQQMGSQINGSPCF